MVQMHHMALPLKERHFLIRKGCSAQTAKAGR